MKAVKILLKVVVALVALVIIAVLALPLWFGPVAKTAANSVVPGIVKTDFHMGHISLNPYSGRFELGDTQLANPAGYSEKFAVTLGDIAFDCEPLSLASDVIHIEEIKVKDVFASVVTKDGVMNFTQIQYNVAGGKEKYEAAQAKAEAEKPAGKKEESEKPAKKIIIDKLEISGLKLQLGILPISLPSVTLTDIGRKSGGATFEEAWQQIVDGVLGAAGALGDQAKALLGSVGDVSKQATEAVGKAAAQATEAANKAAAQATEAASKAAAQATEALGNVTGGATEAAGKATEAIGNVAGGATEAAGKAAESATKAASDAGKAVGDGAKKALDSLKSLW